MGALVALGIEDCLRRAVLALSERSRLLAGVIDALALEA
jgi:hypothetical protein